MRSGVEMFSRWQEAEQDAAAALELSPRNIKAYFRRCIARREQDDFIGARQGEFRPIILLEAGKEFRT